jgi:ABC-type transport system substrate-binding protein
LVPPGATPRLATLLAKKYGVNKGQFWAQPSGFLRMFVLNTSRPLFRKNPKLRRAVNYAVDRKALLRERGGSPGGRLTDQYLTPIKLGFQDEHIYPLTGPDVNKAKQLAKGHTRSGKATLYVSTVPAPVAQAEIIRSNLEEIGLEVEVKAFPVGVLFEKLATPGEPFDIGWIGSEDTDRDPAQFMKLLFDGRTIGLPNNGNLSYFNSAKYNRLLDEAAQLKGDERYRAFGDLDVQLSRDAAPAIPYSYDNTLTLVGPRTGCVIVNPYLDLAAVCLK